LSQGDADLIAVARGDAPPDLVIAGAHVFSVFTREWLEVDVASFGGAVRRVGELLGSPAQLPSRHHGGR
jgi:adenine deaminase